MELTPKSQEWGKNYALRPPTAFKMTKNGQFWPFQPVWHPVDHFLARLKSNSTTKVKIKMCWGNPTFLPGKKVILGPLWPPKRSKMAILGIFAPLKIFWHGSKWNSPIRVKTEVSWGNVRSLPRWKSHFWAPEASKLAKNGQFWPFYLFWHSVDQFFDWN